MDKIQAKKNLPCFHSSPVENFGSVEEKKLLTSFSHIVTSLRIKPLYWWPLAHLLVKGTIAGARYLSTRMTSQGGK